MYIDDSVKNLKEKAIKIRKVIHKNPELCFEKFRTSLLKQKLFAKYNLLKGEHKIKTLHSLILINNG